MIIIIIMTQVFSYATATSVFARVKTLYIKRAFLAYSTKSTAVNPDRFFTL